MPFIYIPPYISFSISLGLFSFERLSMPLFFTSSITDFSPLAVSSPPFSAVLRSLRRWTVKCCQTESCICFNHVLYHDKHYHVQSSHFLPCTHLISYRIKLAESCIVYVLSLFIAFLLSFGHLFQYTFLYLYSSVCVSCQLHSFSFISLFSWFCQCKPSPPSSIQWNECRLIKCCILELRSQDFKIP